LLRGSVILERSTPCGNSAELRILHTYRGRKDMRVAPVKPTIAYELFEQLDIRVGTIERVEDVPGADKLQKLVVDFGDHRRNIVAGIKQERDNPKEIEGQQALFVVNLKPRKMMGVLSEGMLFDIGYADGITPVLAVPEKPVPNGARAG
jgi:tRNA-binding protein